MAFPSNPINNQTTVINGTIYIYSTTKGAWSIVSSSTPSGSSTQGSSGTTYIGASMNLTGQMQAGSVNTVTGGQITGYLTGAIGANTANTGAFTTITATTANVTTVSAGTYTYANGVTFGSGAVYSNANTAAYLTSIGLSGNPNANLFLGPTLSANVTASSLRSVGNLNSLIVTGTATAGSFSGNGASLTYTLGVGTVNVKDFGAKGDGTTDDRTAIQNAINSLTSGVVVFPTGSYLIGSSGGVGLTLKPGVDLVALGGSNVTLLPSTNGTSVLYYLNPTTNTLQSNFVIKGINFSANSKTSCNAIYINGNVSGARCSNIRISDSTITGFSDSSGYGINLVYCANTFITNVFFSTCYTGIYTSNCADTNMNDTMALNGGGNGFYFTGTNSPFNEGYRLTGCSTNGQAVGIYINGCDYGVVSACSFTTCAQSTTPSAGTAFASNHWKFVNCEFSVAGTGTYASGFPGFTIGAASTGVSACTRFAFVGCQFLLNTFGLVLNGTNHVVNGCLFSNNTNVDISLNSTAYVAITGNQCDSGTVGYSVFENGSSNTLVVGNVVRKQISLGGSGSTAASNISSYG
jgi:Pectate lyase superfamily protein